MLSEEQLREIDERSSRTSPGPWTWYCYRCGYEIVTMSSRRAVVQRDGGVCFVGDADFISRAREDVSAMLATIRELQKRVAELEKIADAVVDCRVKEVAVRTECTPAASSAAWDAYWKLVDIAELLIAARKGET